MCISFIRPLMEYADVIWDNQKQNLINKLENIQLDAARIITGGGGGGVVNHSMFLQLRSESIQNKDKFDSLY
jgi:hypothetical protein